MTVVNIQKRYLTSLIALGVLDGLFFGMVSPVTTPSQVLFIGFLLFALSTYALCRGVLLMLGIVLARPLRRSRRLAGFLAILATVLLALQSIGQLTVRDVAVFVVIGVIIMFYVSYFRPRQRV